MRKKYICVCMYIYIHLLSQAISLVYKELLEINKKDKDLQPNR